MSVGAMGGAAQVDVESTASGVDASDVDASGIEATAQADVESAEAEATDATDGEPAPAGDLADPAPLARDAARVMAGAIGLERLRGDLFVDGISADDPQQGVIGDCYLIASMAALAHAAPDKIKDLLRDNGDGTVTVRFQEPQKEGPPIARDVTVDLDFVMGRLGEGGADTPRYATSTDRSVAGHPELWPAIVEKAFAQLKGGYQEIGYGGFASDALEALTGVKSELDGIGERVDAGDRAKAEAINSIFKFGVDVILGSLEKAKAGRGEEAWAWLSGAAAKGMPLVGATYAEADILKLGMMPCHAYAITGVEERNGERFVKLQNPAPYMPELQNDPSILEEAKERPDLAAMAEAFLTQGVSAKDLKYGEFEISWADFRRSFALATRTPL